MKTPLKEVHLQTMPDRVGALVGQRGGSDQKGINITFVPILSQQVFAFYVKIVWQYCKFGNVHKNLISRIFVNL